MKVWYCSSPELVQVCDQLPSNEGRQSLVDSLVRAYELDSNLFPVKRVDRSEIEKFHTSEYVDAILGDTEDVDRFGLSYDCPVFDDMSDYVLGVASAAVTSAKKLIELSEGNDDKESSVVANLFGGRHHCFKNHASGFCYVNDIVLAVNTLRKKFKRVFYLDLDIHHGDGVESAFKFSKNVTTCSIHHYDIGFFPGTGSLESNEPTVINIPTKKGLSDKTMLKIIKSIVGPLMKDFSTEAIVIQAGCDGLATDSKEWNMTIRGYADVVKEVLSWNIPALVLGGGGYNHTETAKCWTYMLAQLQEKPIAQEIPEHSHLDSYEKDGFVFWTQDNDKERSRKDYNDKEYLGELKAAII